MATPPPSLRRHRFGLLFLFHPSRLHVAQVVLDGSGKVELSDDGVEVGDEEQEVVCPTCMPLDALWRIPALVRKWIHRLRLANVCLHHLVHYAQQVCRLEPILRRHEFHAIQHLPRRDTQGYPLRLQLLVGFQ